MMLCQRKLGPVKKDEGEDEISMKNEFQESGRKVMGSHKLGNTSFHRVEEYRGHQEPPSIPPHYNAV